MQLRDSHSRVDPTGVGPTLEEAEAVLGSGAEHSEDIAHMRNDVVSDIVLEDVLEATARSMADLNMVEGEHIGVGEVYAAMGLVEGIRNNRDKAAADAAQGWASLVLDRKKSFHAFGQDTRQAEAYGANLHSVVELV